MKLSKNSKGFAIFEMFVVVGVVGILAFAGYMVYQRSQDKKTNSSVSQTTKPTATKDDVASAPVVKKTADLKSAQTTLDNTNVDSSDDETQLDQDLSAF